MKKLILLLALAVTGCERYQTLSHGTEQPYLYLQDKQSGKIYFVYEGTMKEVAHE